MSRLKVLIVGASIAGPTAAYWFSRAGASVTVIERYPSLRTGGQNIDIRTVGVTVMRKMGGMEAAVRAKIVQLDGMAFMRADGTPFVTMHSTGDPDQQAMISEYEIYRGDLARILVDMTAENERVRYVFGEQVASMMQRADGGPVAVEFANGLLPPQEFDLVVACDGATSRTRSVGFECGVRDHVERLNCWAAYFSLEKDLLEGSKIAQGYSAVGGKFINIKSDPFANVNRVGVIGILPRDNSDATLPFREAAKGGEDSLKQYVSKCFTGIGWKTDEVMQLMMESKDMYGSEIVQVKMPSLSRGRVVLVGDAGYAPGFTGTGTSLAIAGAYILAGEVCKHKGDLQAGLRAYEERMRPIIKDLQKIPPGVFTLLAPQTAWGIQLRNTLFMVVSWGISVSWIFSWVTSLFSGLFVSAFAKDKYGIPDYEWEE